MPTWTVSATIRTVRDDVLRPSARLRSLPLDVTDAASIAGAVDAAGPVDVLVNNAGVGLMNALEGVPMDEARAVFKTNTLGSIAMVQAFLPQFRARRNGVIINVTSSVTLRPLPLLSVYTASKAAVNAFTASLALELEPFGIRARIVLPGRSPETPFGDNARARGNMNTLEPYAEFAANHFARMQQARGDVTRALDVAQAVWRAATDPVASPIVILGDDLLSPVTVEPSKIGLRHRLPEGALPILSIRPYGCGVEAIAEAFRLHRLLRGSR